MQVPGAAALELVELMKDVPKGKGGTACSLAATILQASRSAMERLVDRASKRRRTFLVKLLLDKFPMEYISRELGSSSTTPADAGEALADADEDAAVCAAVMVADPSTLTPRKMAMRVGC